MRELQLSQLAALALRVHQGFFESSKGCSVFRQEVNFDKIFIVGQNATFTPAVAGGSPGRLRGALARPVGLPGPPGRAELMSARAGAARSPPLRRAALSSRRRQGGLRRRSAPGSRCGRAGIDAATSGPPAPAARDAPRWMWLVELHCQPSTTRQCLGPGVETAATNPGAPPRGPSRLYRLARMLS